MKQGLKIGFFVSFFTIASLYPEDVQSKKLALEIIASISDDIATLIINKNHEKDPEVAKASCVRLITNLADALATVIIKMKASKEVRGIELMDESEYQNALNDACKHLMSKIENDIKD